MCPSPPPSKEATPEKDLRAFWPIVDEDWSGPAYASPILPIVGSYGRFIHELVTRPLCTSLCGLVSSIYRGTSLKRSCTPPRTIIGLYA